MQDAGFTVLVLEKSASIGGTFVHKAYDDARLVSSKFLTTFSDLRPAAGASDHMTLPEYVDYLTEYCEQQRLWPLISFGSSVVSVKKATPSTTPATTPPSGATDGPPGHIVRYRKASAQVRFRLRVRFRLSIRVRVRLRLRVRVRGRGRVSAVSEGRRAGTRAHLRR